jgi:energy-coupling factor transporter ATP-binding protein EcfA2
MKKKIIKKKVVVEASVNDKPKSVTDLGKLSFDTIGGKTVKIYRENGKSYLVDSKGKLSEIPEESADTAGSNNIWDGILVSENLIEEIAQAIKPFVYFGNPVLYCFTTIFTIITYVFNFFEAIPYLHLTGAKGSGKTTLVKILSSLSHNSISTVSVTPATMFRLIDKEQPTLFVDEVEDLEKRGTSNNQIIQVLNSGYKKGGVGHRVLKGVSKFSTYCPKVIAGINSLSPALADRCITIEMQKASSSNKVEYLTNDDQNKLESLKPVIVRTLEKKMPELRKIIENPASLKLNPEIQNRELEKWFPILAIAKVFSTKKNNYFEQIQKYAVDSIISSIQEDTSPETVCRSILIDFIAGNAAKTLFPGDKNYFSFRTDRIFQLIKRVDAHNYYRNQRELTIVLTKIGVKSERHRFGSDPVGIYKIPRTMINQKKEK